MTLTNKMYSIKPEGYIEGVFAYGSMPLEQGDYIISHIIPEIDYNLQTIANHTMMEDIAEYDCFHATFIKLEDKYEYIMDLAFQKYMTEKEI